MMSSMSTASDPSPALRSGERSGRVTNVELFFDLVYVFAITQLSSLLEQRADQNALGAGALQALILLALVWQAWAYTTWVTNWLDPDRLPTRLMLLAVMLGSLVLSACLPEAFGDRGLAVAVTYVVIQVGRSVFAILALRTEPWLRLNFQRIVLWSAVSGVAMIAGAEVHGHAREAIWAAAVAFDFLGGRVGFWTPVLGRAHTDDWQIDGAHFAERCQGFVLIALGESIVVIGSGLDGPKLSASTVAAFVAAFAGSAALWWVYFDRAAERSSQAIAASDDPGRLGASAYHLVHPVIVAGIIAAAAADHLVLADPSRRGVASTSWLLLGGAALFLAGHALFEALVFKVFAWTRIAAVVVLIALGLLAPHVSALVLGTFVLAIILAVAITDRAGAPPE
jgi:low temperature requirement protein LtrA